jgi:hypothetical protein
MRGRAALIRPLQPRDEAAWTAMRAALWPDAGAGDLAAVSGTMHGKRLGRSRMR